MFQIIKESMVIQQEHTNKTKKTTPQTTKQKHPKTTKSTLQNRANNLTTMHLKVSVNTDASW